MNMAADKTENRNLVPENVRLLEDDSAVVIIDQSLLPGQKLELELKTAEEMYEAIYELKVRGAPAIGICAGFCLYVLANAYDTDSYEEFLGYCRDRAEYLNSSRPTAVNLSWALGRMIAKIEGSKDLPIFGTLSVSEIKRQLRAEALKIQQEDVEMCRAISAHGLSLLKDGYGILTHCNAGPLATSLYGTALGPIILGSSQGMKFKVFADETRPLLQGARLTSYELQKAGVDVCLICDNMASIVMKNGWVDACLVGCDRIAANGDTANKIGTSGLAIIAKHYGIPFYVLGPTSTIDMSCKTGEDIEVELRDPEEIKKKWYSQPMAPEEVECYNPAFDVTDASLISGIVTQHGICRPPYTESLAKLAQEITHKTL